MTRSNMFRRLSAAVVAVALLIATTATGATEQKKHSRTDAPGDARSADERIVNHSLVQSRGDVVSTIRCGLVYPQSGPRRPVTHE
jgi:hypothetical protein